MAPLLLGLLALVLLVQYQRGTLGQWIRAKFLGQTISPAEAVAAAFERGAPTSPWQNVFTDVLGGGRWIRPLPGRTISPFGAPRDGGRRTHEGIDIAGPQGARIVAARTGDVTFAGSRGNYGLLVTLDHGGGFESRYAHLDRIVTRSGDRLAGGAGAVGTVGTTGNAEGGVPHLHFEIRKDGVALDPAELVGG